MKSETPESPTPGLDAHGRTIFLGCIAFAVLVHILFYLNFDIRRPVEPDTTFYVSIAESLSSGRGYQDPLNFWPNTPTTGRSPGWPGLLAAVYLVLGNVFNHDVLVRIFSGLFSIGAGAFSFLAAYHLYRSTLIAGTTSVLVSVIPGKLYLAEQGMSEPVFIFFVLGGFLSLTKSSAPLSLSSSIWLGVATLFRSNFVLFGPCFLGLILASRSRPPIKKCLIWLAVFSLPSALWVVRNYAASGKFPVLSTIRGETFYGAYNSKAYFELDTWGYWIFPNNIPGETPKIELAKKFSEEELDEYYYSKGKEFLWQNLGYLPRTVMGRLIRGFVPLPWVSGKLEWVAALMRFVIFLGALATVLLIPTGMRSEAKAFLWSIFLVVLTTTVTFYGCARFTVLLEPFLCLLAAVGFSRFLRRAGRISAPIPPS